LPACCSCFRLSAHSGTRCSSMLRCPLYIDQPRNRYTSSLLWSCTVHRPFEDICSLRSRRTMIGLRSLGIAPLGMECKRPARHQGCTDPWSSRSIQSQSSTCRRYTMYTIHSAHTLRHRRRCLSYRRHIRYRSGRSRSRLYHRACLAPTRRRSYRTSCSWSTVAVAVEHNRLTRWSPQQRSDHSGNCCRTYGSWCRIGLLHRFRSCLSLCLPCLI
jgi:hypothetical protein